MEKGNLCKDIGRINRGHLELNTFNGNIGYNQPNPIICKNKIYISIKVLSNLQRLQCCHGCHILKGWAILQSTVQVKSFALQEHPYRILRVHLAGAHTCLDPSIPSHSTWQGLVIKPTYLTDSWLQHGNLLEWRYRRHVSGSWCQA